MAAALPFEFFVGLRYVTARKTGGNRFVSFISLISMLGLTLGVAALIVVLSVMNGFQKELRTRILGVAAHAQISGLDGELDDWPHVVEAAHRHARVLAAAPYVQQQALLSSGENVKGAVIRGILPSYEEQVADFSRFLRAGELAALEPGSYGIVLGSELAWALRVRVGDKVTVIAPQGVTTLTGVLPRMKAFTVVGIFEAGMFEYDSGLALVALADAQKLYQMEARVTGVRLKVDDLFAAPLIARELAAGMPGEWRVSDWTRNHANFFRAVQIEKNIMFLILMLIVAVAAFNIVSTLIMTVQDKRGDIAILRTLGASPLSIMGIFMIQGAAIGTIGLACGIAGGVALALNVETVVPAIERALNIQFLAKDVYYISELPSDLHWSDVWTIASTSFLLTLAATLYPSWRAARVEPAQALRYE